MGSNPIPDKFIFFFFTVSLEQLINNLYVAKTAMNEKQITLEPPFIRKKSWLYIEQEVAKTFGSGESWVIR